LKRKNLTLRYDIFHHCSASSVNLQIIDYIGWAVHRKYEMDDVNYYNKIKEYIIDEDIVTKDRKNRYYEKWPNYLSEEASLGVLSVVRNLWYDYIKKKVIGS